MQGKKGGMKHLAERRASGAELCRGGPGALPRSPSPSGSCTEGSPPRSSSGPLRGGCAAAAAVSNGAPSAAADTDICALNAALSAALIAAAEGA